MTEPDTSRKSGTPRWTKILLVASLALNFIFVGAAVGFMLRGHGGRGPISRDGAFLIASAMPLKDRRDLIHEFRQRRREISGEFTSTLEQRRMIIEILEQTPFDPDALLRVLGEQRERGLSVATVGHEAVVSRLGEMSDSDRQEIARNLRERKSRKPR